MYVRVCISAASKTFVSDTAAMHAFLNMFGNLVCKNDWSLSTAPGYIEYFQHECEPTANWESYTVTVLFNHGAKTAPLPVTNFFVSAKLDGKDTIRLQILSLKPNYARANVFGKQFFANQWVEIDQTKLRVGFAPATSANDRYPHC